LPLQRECVDHAPAIALVRHRHLGKVHARLPYAAVFRVAAACCSSRAPCRSDEDALVRRGHACESVVCPRSAISAQMHKYITVCRSTQDAPVLSPTCQAVQVSACVVGGHENGGGGGIRPLEKLGKPRGRRRSWALSILGYFWCMSCSRAGKPKSMTRACKKHHNAK
jgi:hypothetical protein